MEGKLSKYSETKKFLEANYKEKQLVLNQYIDELVELKHELAEKEKKINKLQSYHASSYILECILYITPNDNDSEKNKKGIGSEYHQVPPPLENNYTFCDDEKVVKGINTVNQLLDNIDVTYSKYDEVGDSEVVSKVVESVLEEDSTKNDSSKFQVEDE
ncbi:hypothetical protein Hanom_Chr10g00901831 [Helianthus anomalus]